MYNVFRLRRIRHIERSEISIFFKLISHIFSLITRSSAPHYSFFIFIYSFGVNAALLSHHSYLLSLFNLNYLISNHLITPGKNCPAPASSLCFFPTSLHSHYRYCFRIISYCPSLLFPSKLPMV